MTTIKVPKALRDRLHELAVEDRLTLAQEIEHLIKQAAPRRKPTVGGFRSERPYSAAQIEDELMEGFGK